MSAYNQDEAIALLLKGETLPPEWEGEVLRLFENFTLLALYNPEIQTEE